MFSTDLPSGIITSCIIYWIMVDINVVAVSNIVFYSWSHTIVRYINISRISDIAQFDIDITFC